MATSENRTAAGGRRSRPEADVLEPKLSLVRDVEVEGAQCVQPLGRPLGVHGEGGLGALQYEVLGGDAERTSAAATSAASAGSCSSRPETLTPIVKSGSGWVVSCQARR